ncbi:hypothetical protein [Georgenia daeguensis]|uniref:Tight adherence protein B n=1 Tax=Georgenia daeguensis TaxID=908355 RepID=A0ABP6UMZ4_9MICO
MTEVVTVAVLVASAVLLLVRPGRHPAPRSQRRRKRLRPRARRRPGTREIDLGVLVTEVATRLKAGADVDAAWDETFARAGLTGRTAAREDGVPGQLLELAARHAAHDRLPRPVRRLVRHPPGIGSTTAGALPGAIAACRLTHELGAPLAEVLVRCADGLTEAGHARAARAVALAGPRATARLLGWLPVLGLVLGAGIGADPVGVLLGGGLGSACLLAGVVLMVAGRRWVVALERAAGAAGTGGDGRAAR